MPKLKESEESLKGWVAIAKFLSQPVSTVQRWANEGMDETTTSALNTFPLVANKKRNVLGFLLWFSERAKFQ